jgi:hypothetical protein
MPPDAQEINSLRIVVRPHLNQDVTEILARDIRVGLRLPRAARRVRNPTEAS